MKSRATLSKEKRDELIPEIRTYVGDNFEEEIGDLKATLLLDFMLERIGPALYNKAVRDCNAYLQDRLLDMEGELLQDERRKGK